MTYMKQEIKIVGESWELNDIITTHIKLQANGNRKIEILEAGCGRNWPFDLRSIQYSLTGIDIDQDALEARKRRKNDLDNVLVDDIRRDILPANSYDVIYSSFVLEHIEGADAVLKNFQKWLKPGGLIILKFPDRDSVFGFVTRVTPFWFHVLYKRYLNGECNAGKPGFGPYPTCHDKVLSRASFYQFVKDSNLLIKEEYGFGTMPPFRSLFTKLIQFISFDKLIKRCISKFML